MGATIVDVADALVTELNSDPLTNFGVNFTAVRSYADWEMKLEDNEQINCDVVPQDYPEYDMVGRGSPTSPIIGRLAAVRVGLRKRMATEQGRVVLSEMDEMVFAIEQMADYTFQLALTDLTTATWDETNMLSPWSRKDLREWQQYTGIIEVVYRLDTAP